MSIYTKQYTLKNTDVNLFRVLRTSRLFEFLQEVSILHTEQLGAGKEKTLDKGLLWVVTMQRCEIYRLPEYDETITLETYPGKQMHVLFPRYYFFKDEKENTLIKAGAIWTLVDQETRHFAFPEEYDIHIEGEKDDTICLPSPLPSIHEGKETVFTVPFSYVDLNGHMNNARYFDLVDDISIQKNMHLIETEYMHELHYHDEVHILHDDHVFMGTVSDQQAFKIRIQ